jgi:Raf kinase inhibitor-like YbhB/YbcL family protein
MVSLTLTSPAFEDGEKIPGEYGYKERNVNPPLKINGVPGGTQSLVLIMDDPDAVDPAGKVWDHWIVWNIDPNTTEIPENWDPADTSAVEGQNDYGETGYGGPNPPDREHTYQFELSALETTLDFDESATKEDLQPKIAIYEIAKAELEGMYAP